MKNEKGFSLVELLIVLLIIGVIAQLAIPNLLRSRMAGNEGSAINTVRTIISAEMLFVTTVGEESMAPWMCSLKVPCWTRWWDLPPGWL